MNKPEGVQGASSDCHPLDEWSFDSLCQQYRGLLFRQAEACGGWEALGLKIGEMVEELRKRREAQQGAG